VGHAFGVTRERVRQIETHSLRKLRALPEAERLRVVAGASACGRDTLREP